MKKFAEDSCNFILENKIISLLAGADRHVYMLDAKKQPHLISMGNGEIIPIAEISCV